MSSPGDPGRRAAAVIFAVVAALVVLAAVVAVTKPAGLRHRGWSGTPDRVSACGRDYNGPGDSFTLAEVRQEGAQLVGRAWVWFSSRELWATASPSATWADQQTVAADRAGGAPCGLAVYLRAGPDAFLAYSLSGGP